jgi:thiamine biosynthesis lipoprotein
MIEFPLEWPPSETITLPHREGDHIATRSFRAIGTTAAVAVTDSRAADEALKILDQDLNALDTACSRFREDSELRMVELASDGSPIPVSPLLFAVLEVACTIAARTAGIVDPTIGTALVELGYDRDYDHIVEASVHHGVDYQPAPGWWQIRLDPEERSVSVPRGVHIDVGATGKAYAADRSSLKISSELGCGVMVNIGGDIAVAGVPPRDGWAVGIGSHCTTPSDQVDLVLSVFGGGVATSGTTGRTWMHDGRRMHHIVDPWTGEPAEPIWAFVSTLAPSCVEANAWSTAAVVWGDDAVGNLAAMNISARLVRADGEVVEVGGWPSSADIDSLKGAVS